MVEGDNVDAREFSENAIPFYDFHSQLKPAWEPILLCSKPTEGKTLADNALEYGVAGLNIGACRIGNKTEVHKSNGYDGGIFGDYGPKETKQLDHGRFPSNVILSHDLNCQYRGTQKIKAITGGGGVKQPGRNGIYGEFKGHEYEGKLGYFDQDGNETVEVWDCVEDCPVRMLNEQTSHLKSGKFVGRNRNPEETANKIYGAYKKDVNDVCYKDSGGASRFYYCAKPSRSERQLGCEHLYWKKVVDKHILIDKETWESLPENERSQGNVHLTIKPISVLSHLCRLLKMPFGTTILDPFMGSGTTGIACLYNDINFIGIDIEESYVTIAEARLNHALAHKLPI